jgi:flavin reductase (DIM6/NTAB) family NADH-FMN oxidoreductase RutF
MQAAANVCTERDRFITAMAMAATPVTVVTTDGGAGRFGLTVSAVSSVSADPPMLLACVNRKSPAADAITKNGRFAVNLLAAEGRAFAETFSGRPREGKPFDFANHDWEISKMGMPIVPEACAVFECEVEQATDAGTHRIFIGRVLASRRGEAEPLIYCNRNYGRVAAY